MEPPPLLGFLVFFVPGSYGATGGVSGQNLCDVYNLGRSDLCIPPVGRTVPGAPLRCPSRRRYMVAETSVYSPTVGVGVLDDPSVGQRKT